MNKIECLVSVVVAVTGSEDIIEKALPPIHAVLDQHYTGFEIVLVEAGSRDKTLDHVEPLLAQFKGLRLLRLPRSINNELALTAGVDSSIGDFVVTMALGADPPEEIPKMIERAREGRDVVIGVAENFPDGGPIHRLFRAPFTWLCRSVLDIDLIDHATGFRVLSRQAVSAVTRIRKKHRYLMTLIQDVGYRAALHPYQCRFLAGKVPKKGLLRKIKSGISFIISNSTVPLKIVSIVGLIGSFFSAAYIVYVIAIYFIREGRLAEGWLTLSLQSTGLFFLNFIILAMIGEYLGRVLDETIERPLYHVHEERNSSVMYNEESRVNVLDSSTEEDVDLRLKPPIRTHPKVNEGAG